jgi:serine/threonine protein kinase
MRLCPVQDEPLPEAQLKLWLAQALLALLCLQEHGVLHRDLKPANLYRSDEDDLLIGDFGLAALRRGEEGEDSSVVGTPQCMSPELISGAEYSFASDIWCAAPLWPLKQSPLDLSGVQHRTVLLHGHAAMAQKMLRAPAPAPHSLNDCGARPRM